ncbi:MAG: hypothetical protein P8I38_01325 [Arenicella sp.]|nr:hypothetical protein [Arenicella sp.]HAU68653.1 hypothetical protein [Gammaproteobacteria bacterium]
MKKSNSVLLALVIAFTMTACSSGTTVSPEPINLTGLYKGTFTNTDENSTGTITLNIAESIDGTTVSGNIIFESDDTNCLSNGPITGTISGFSLALTADQINSNESGSTVSTGTLSAQLTQSNNGNNLDGTYVTANTVGLVCSNQSGSGTMNLVRS